MRFNHVLPRKPMLVLILQGLYKQQVSKLFALTTFHWKNVAESVENVKKEKKDQQENTKE